MSSSSSMISSTSSSVTTEMLEKMFVDHETKVKKIVDDSLIVIHDGLSGNDFSFSRNLDEGHETIQTKYDFFLVAMLKMQDALVKTFEAKLAETVSQVSQEFKSYVEAQIMLKTCVDQFSLDVKTIIEDVRSFNKDYIMKMLQTDDSYLKSFQDLKLSTDMLEKKIHTVNHDQIATILTFVQKNF